MLKITFWLLFLINAGLLAFQQGYLDELFPSSREPTRMNQQLNASKLSLLASADAPAVNQKTSAAPVAAAAATPAPASAAAASVQADKPTAACTEVGAFDDAEAKRFETQLAPLALGDRLTRRAVQEASRYIVYMPPQGSKDAADKKAGELKRLGVNDFFVIQDNSPLQWGISLGVFKSEESARKQLAELNQKGVRSARVGTQGTGPSKLVFQLHGLDAAAQASLSKIKQAFPHQDWRDCP
ncbi:MAG TPA: SPOR domain-containing protein [Oxalicibacterium sp.]|nr:SPOR domain-containing protein [Oxalicibacterium sp.]